MGSKNWNEFEKELKALCHLWYNRRQFSLRKIQKLLNERGVDIHYSTISRWLKKQAFQLPEAKENGVPVIEEVKIMVKGQVLYLYTLRSQETLYDFKLLRKPKSLSSGMFEFRKTSATVQQQSEWQTDTEIKKSAVHS